MKQKTTKQWIKEAKAIHGNKYDYSKVEYKDTHTKVCIICPQHGEFWQEPKLHLKGYGCKKCSIENKISYAFNEFIEKAKQIHGDKYDYSKVEYKNNRTKVCIICPIHGEFWQTPDVHLRGCGCQKCGYNKEKTIKTTLKEFIEKARTVHGNKYDYTKVDYKGCKTKVCITCPKHGEFWQTPESHLNGNGCVKCYDEEKRGKSRQHNKEWFIKKSREIHGDKYDYSKIEYKTITDKVCIFCPIHGEFWQTPANHIWSKNGCQICGGTKKLSKEEFIEKARKLHGDKYDYSKVEYINNKTKVLIICPTHGEFLQTPNSHLIGNGCPKCHSSHLETELRLFLAKNNIKYEEQKAFKWLKLKSKQYLDFYLSQYNVAIECQGEQHFQKSGWGKNDNGKKVICRDLNKKKLCEENGIKLLYYSNLGIEYPYEVFEDKNKLLQKIKR